jgi:hypothetical protein
MRIELHIERVVLEGISDAGDAREIQEALTAELGRLLATAPRSMWRESGHLRRSAATTCLPSAGRPAELGRSVAAGVHTAVLDSLSPKGPR